MKRRNNRRMSRSTALLFAAAIVLLAFSGIGGARAALGRYSQTYSARAQMQNIGVTLQENGKDVAWRNYDTKSADGTWKEATGVLMQNIAPQGEALATGKAYTEHLTVKNSGTIDQYVRVSIHKYWVDKNGNKVQSLSPDLIKLHVLENSGWIVDQAASTSERTVLYYNQILKSGAVTPNLSDTLTIDDAVSAQAAAYSDMQFAVEAEVDAVQTHNASDAIWSAWGRRVNIDKNGQLTLQ